MHDPAGARQPVVPQDLERAALRVQDVQHHRQIALRAPRRAARGTPAPADASVALRSPHPVEADLADRQAARPPDLERRASCATAARRAIIVELVDELRVHAVGRYTSGCARRSDLRSAQPSGPRPASRKPVTPRPARAIACASAFVADASRRADGSASRTSERHGARMDARRAPAIDGRRPADSTAANSTNRTNLKR